MSATAVDIRRILTAPQVARLLGLSRETIYAACRRGEIPHVRIGRLVRFDAATIRRWKKGLHSVHATITNPETQDPINQARRRVLDGMVGIPAATGRDREAGTPERGDRPRIRDRKDRGQSEGAGVGETYPDFSYLDRPRVGRKGVVAQPLKQVGATHTEDMALDAE